MENTGRNLNTVKELLAQIGKMVGFEVSLFKNLALPRYIGNKISYIEPLPLTLRAIAFHMLRKEEGFSPNRFVVAGKDNQTPVIYFTLMQFPGCCGLALSTGASIAENFQGRGLNLPGIQLRQEIARIVGFTNFVCTDVTKNIRQRKTLAREGFKDIYTFVNRRTNNEIAISIKELGRCDKVSWFFEGE